MESLIQKQKSLLARTDLSFRRYMFSRFPWSARMTGLLGPRGVGKTTMLLQYIKENQAEDILYVSADDLYFANHTLFDIADEFYKNGGTHFFIDEIHKYKDWSVELKNIYDTFPGLSICFTGSSILDIRKGMADLSRRALMFTMQGLSFREYLEFEYGLHVRLHSLNDIVTNSIDLPDTLVHPLPLFHEYLQKGYYPMVKEDHLEIRLGQIVNHTLEVDIPQFANLSVTTARKLRKLLMVIAESVPFKPNYVSLAAKLEISRNSLEEYFTLMEDAGLIARLRDAGSGIIGLGKVEKIYLDNPNLAFFLSEKAPDIGNIRETFFLNQARVNHRVISSVKADFTVGNYTFEVGGKNKNQKQIKNTGNGLLVKDNIEYGHDRVIPLWAFGLNY